jgi:putative ABC transport system ATP-binding protein
MSTEVPALIELEDVRKSYRMGDTDVDALAGVTLSIDRGEYLAIMGPSGSGKSTLMQLVGCLDTPSAGSYRLDGTSVDRLDDEELSALRNRKIAFVFQAFNLIPTLTVLENVALPLSYRNTPRAEAAQRAAGMLESLGLADRHKHRPNELSGGECQRVAIARALVTEPEVILADEPTGNLDTRTGEEVMEILGGLHDSGTTIVIVTHDPSKARRAQRLVQMQDGRIRRELSGEQMDRVTQPFAAATAAGALEPRAAPSLAASRTRGSFTKQFKAEVVERIRTSGNTVSTVCRELNLRESTVRRWLKRARVDSAGGRVGALTTAEREEFARLRERVNTLELERKRQEETTAFFAKETR